MQDIIDELEARLKEHLVVATRNLSAYYNMEPVARQIPYINCMNRTFLAVATCLGKIAEIKSSEIIRLIEEAKRGESNG